MADKNQLEMLEHSVKEFNTWRDENPGEPVTLNDMNLAGMNLRNADLRNSKLVSADLRNAKLEGANLEGTNLILANLRGANLEGANFTGAEADANTEMDNDQKKEFTQQGGLLTYMAAKTPDAPNAQPEASGEQAYDNRDALPASAVEVEDLEPGYTQVNVGRE